MKKKGLPGAYVVGVRIQKDFSKEFLCGNFEGDATSLVS
jgi:hypothetical protein